MRLSQICRCAALPCSQSRRPALATTPEEAWKAEIADANIGWAKAPHAILKIQDAAYLRDGDAATLVGTKGKPDTYKWVEGHKRRTAC